MKFNFDDVVDRKNTNSTKWDRYEGEYIGTIPLWVADMDFKVCKEIVDGILKRLQHGVFGYTDAPQEVYESIIAWERKRHGIVLERDNIILSTGVVYSLYLLLNSVLKENGKIMVEVPVYPSLVNIPLHLGKEVIQISTNLRDNNWSKYLEKIEEILKKDKEIKVFILCNPNNPTGKCYSKYELNKLFSIFYKYGVYIISDEIHSDIIMPNNCHNSALNTDEIYHKNIILLSSPTKTFNLAGLKISYVLIKDLLLKKEFEKEAKISGLSSINIFGYNALISAFNEGEKWLDELLIYILNNFIFVKEYLSKNLPLAKFNIPDATYLGWVDLSDYNLNENFCDELKHESKVQFEAGNKFYANKKGCIRINVACSRVILEEGLKRLVNYINKRRRNLCNHYY